MTSYRDMGRDFEFEFDVSDLFEYEMPEGPGRLGPPAAPKASFLVLGRYEPGKFSTHDFYRNALLRIAHLLVSAQRLNMPSEVALMGYPDAPGTDQATQNLAFNRASDVRTKLRDMMNGITPGSAERTAFSIYVNTAPGAGLKQSVDVRLPMTCQIFFADLDFQSFNHDVIGFAANPTVRNKLARFTDVTFVIQELRIRLDDRASEVLKGNIKKAKAETRKHVLDAAKLFSTMQLDLFKKYYPGTPHGFDVKRLMSCFMKFANGEIRSPDPAFDRGPNKDRKQFGVGEPDSSQFFMFAEFAFFCIESGIDVDAWTHALPAMVAPQEVFMHVYRQNPTSPPPAFDAVLPDVLPGKTLAATHPLKRFGASNFKQTGGQTKGEGQSDAGRIKSLTDKYSTMSVAALRDAAAMILLRAQLLK